MKFFVHILIPLFFLSACTGSVKTPPQISGVVQLGRVKNAVIHVYRLSESGELLQPALEETKTNEDGEYVLKTSPVFHGPLVVIAKGDTSGGTQYTDEISVENITLQATDELMAVVDSSSDFRVAITPVSTVVAVHVMEGVREVGIVGFSSLKNKALRDAAMMWGMDVQDMETVPAHPEKLEQASLKELRAAFILFVFSQFLHDEGEPETGSSVVRGVSPVSFIRGLAEDSLDGELDGKNSRIPKGGRLQKNELRSLATASAAVDQLSTRWTVGTLFLLKVGDEAISIV